MPIYEYACRDCGHELEVIQKMSDLPLQECPACGQSSLTKKISAAGFRLKGTGWYATDFKDKKTAKAPETSETPGTTSPSEKTSVPATESSSSTPTESKETKKETAASPANP